MDIKELENDGRRWFSINGQDDNTGVCFVHETYGLTTDGTILDSDGCPLTPGDTTEISVRAAIESMDNTDDIDIEADVVNAIDISEQAMNDRFAAIEAQIAEGLSMLQDIKVLDARIKDLESRQDKPYVGPFELEINTPVKLPREVALAFTEGNVSDGMTLVIEAVYIDGLLTLRSMEMTDDGQELTDDESRQYDHSCNHFVKLYDIAIDPVVDDDYADVFSFPDLVWNDGKWIEAPADEWHPLGDQ